MKATKPTGPVAATAMPVNTTAAASSASRERSDVHAERAREVVAELEHVAPAARARESTGESSASAAASGQTCSQPRPLTDPTSHT